MVGNMQSLSARSELQLCAQEQLAADQVRRTALGLGTEFLVRSESRTHRFYMEYLPFPGGGFFVRDVVYGGTDGNVLIVDGTGRPAYVGDVAVSGGTIVHVGDIGSIRGDEELEVDGLVIAPGFINLHSHARHQGLPTAENVLGQGVTTEILNADGGGPIYNPS